MTARSRALGPEKIAISKPPSSSVHWTCQSPGVWRSSNRNAGVVTGYAHIWLTPLLPSECLMRDNEIDQIGRHDQMQVGAVVIPHRHVNGHGRRSHPCPAP